MWGEITYPFPNFHGCTIEFGNRLNNFTPHFIPDMIHIHAWIQIKVKLVKGTPGDLPRSYEPLFDQRMKSLIFKDFFFTIISARGYPAKRALSAMRKHGG